MNESRTFVLPRDRAEGQKTREIVTSIVKSCWKAVNEWTAALNSGLGYLKSAVAILVSMKPEDELPSVVHTVCQDLDASLEVMKKVIKTLRGLKEQLQKLMEIEEKVKPGSAYKPLFSTIPLKRFHEVLSHILDSYEKETSIKIHACKPLPCTYDAEILNAAITLWTNHLYLPQPHLYHIKILLHETQLL